MDINFSNLQNNKYYKVINVCGFFYSGSSAVVDLLKEYEGYHTLNVEFHLLRPPNGILGLQQAFADPSVSDKKAITNFIHTALQQSRTTPLDQIKTVLKVVSNYLHLIGAENLVHVIPRYYFRLTGKNFFSLKERGYEKKLGGGFRKATSRYIQQLRKEKNRGNCRMFEQITRAYLNEVFNQFDKTVGKNLSSVILDQAIPPFYPYLKWGLNYFDNAKIIIVDRDPRDQYIEGRDLFPLRAREVGLEFNNRIDAFIKWRRYVLKKTCAGKDSPEKILRIRFEDLVNNYKEMAHKIQIFLNEPPSAHKFKRKYFKPEVSKKNIGLYRKYSQKNEIRIIEKVF